MRGLSNFPCTVLGILLAVSLCGCGGGSGRNSAASAGRKGGKGRLTVTFKWPTPAKAAKRHRFIPLASMSVVVTVNGPTGFTATSPPLTPTGSGANATSAYTFNTVPTGSISVTSTAFPNPDGTGTAQASATNLNVTIQANQTASLSLTMDSTITAANISGSQQLTRTRASDYTVTFQDGGGNTVLVDPSTVSWNTDDPSIAIVTNLDPTHLIATVSGVTARQTNLHAVYQEPGQAAQFPNNPNRQGDFNNLQILPIIYICDQANNNIVEVDNINGDNRATLPPTGASYSFTQPRSVAVDSVGGVYVADTGANRVVRVNNPNGSDLAVLSSANGTNFSNVTAVAVDNSDNIYVLDNGNGRIVQCTYNQTNNTINFAQQFAIAPTRFHYGLAPLNPGTFVYTEDITSRGTAPSPLIVQFDGSTSTTFSGQGVVSLQYPWGIVANNGNFYFSDVDSNQVIQLNGQTSNNGTLNFDTITVSSRINAASSIALNAPRGLAFDGYNHLYIADTGNQRIVQADVTFGLGLIFGSSGTYTPSGGSALNAPYAVAVDQPLPRRF